MNMINITQQVNRVGKYLYNHIDSAYKYRKSSNTVDVFMFVLYQIPIARRPIGDQETHEMHLIISVTTYVDKLRINIIEISPEERTLGHFTIAAEKLDDLSMLYDEITTKVRKLLDRAYQDYNFLY